MPTTDETDSTREEPDSFQILYKLTSKTAICIWRVNTCNFKKIKNIVMSNIVKYT